MPEGPTVVRLLTPPGSGAIGLVRLSGPGAVDVASRHIEGHDLRSLAHDRIVLARFCRDGERVDEIMVTIGPPNVVDMYAHGGIGVIEQVLASLVTSGATLGDGSEAPYFSDGAMAPVEREVIAIFPRVRGWRGAEALAAQRQRLPGAIGDIARLCESEPQRAADRLRDLIDGREAVRRAVDGARVAVVGPPNCGKSTLFNLLAGSPAAIVSEVAGTTRDWLEQPLEIDGLPVTLVDTAGLHETPSELESQAIVAGRARASGADAVICLLDGSNPLPVPLPWHHEHAVPFVLAINKRDLAPAWRTDEPSIRETADKAASVVPLSALTGEGLDALVEAVRSVLDIGIDPTSQPAAVSDAQVERWRSYVSALPDDAMRVARRLAAEASACEFPGDGSFCR